MKISPFIRRDRGLTLVEVLVVFVVAMMLILVLFLPALIPMRPTRAPRIQCVNNLKQVGLSYRIWAGNHNDKFPMELSETNGGTMEFVTGPNAFHHFQVMSNELSTPKTVFCPQETDTPRSLATNFIDFNNSNISFFVGIYADEYNPNMILAGDHNLTNGIKIRKALLDLAANSPAGWTAEMHNKVGNILLADGSVQQTSVGDLRKIIAKTSFSTNWLQMPVLGP